MIDDNEKEKNVIIYEGEELPKISWFDLIINVFIAPSETFKRVAEEPKVLSPLIVGLIATLASISVMIPKMISLVPQEVEKMMATGKLPSHQTEEFWIKFLERQIYIGTYFNAIFMMFLSLLFVTLVIFIFFKFTDRDATFKHVFSVVTYSNLINSLNSILISILLLATKFKGINSLRDFQGKSLGFQLLMNADNLETTFQKLTYVLLSLNSPFYIWNLVVLTIGVKYIFKTTYSKACAPVIITWAVISAIVILFSMIAIKSGQL
ncbi:MAG TPA: YIP1 family protein [Firmicutes bacterium]|nr:YIP1 family protein [Bacillota bacterium]